MKKESPTQFELNTSPFARTRVMGIVNVTPDSFSDGGKWASADAAIKRGHELMAQGADILDIGGESTRPGAQILTADEEWARIETVVAELSASYPVSVDTYHAKTAIRAVEAGAFIINDVTGGQGDPKMFDAIVSTQTNYILQHGRGNAQSMNSLANYTNVGDEVASEIRASLRKAFDAGMREDQIIIDPGFGFAKMGEDDWNLAVNMDAVMGIGLPVLVGVSRKRFLERVGTLKGGERGLTPLDRDDATAAFTSHFARMGVWAVRVHEVAASRVAVDVEEQLMLHWQMLNGIRPGAIRHEGGCCSGSVSHTDSYEVSGCCGGTGSHGVSVSRSGGALGGCGGSCGCRGH
ncbi:dihydropteroate synthase [Actinotignum urinale]|uniref:Dihydropteroate synthase n=1 Tax=Actinotignum urinale TaxID=190146 RepID=A0ABU5G6H9_9ACTO|nr:dihydropteroate synthase [Actinotignum urinale]MDY5132952.1 dihydropteroate synthase [Actinotignum urinale]